MFCHRCGTKLPDDSVFCVSCGNKIVPPEQPISPPPPVPGQTGDASSSTIVRTSGPSPTGATSGDYPPFANYPNSPNSSPQPVAASYPFNPQHPASMPPGSSPYSSYPQEPVSSPPYPPNPGTYPPGSFPYPSYAPNSQPIPQSNPMPAPAPVAIIPQNAGQRLLVRTFGPSLASNGFFGMILGGMIAVILGVVVSGIVVALAHAIAPHLSGQNSPFYAEDLMDYALGITPLHNLFRDALQLFVVMQGAGVHELFVPNGGNSSYFYDYNAPLYGLLVIPALFLMLGGYLSACTDYRQNIRTSLLRGAAIALPYAALLLLLTTQINGCIPSQQGGNSALELCSTIATSSTSASSITIDTTTLLLFGLIWGALFGLLGATFKLAQGSWRHYFHQLLRTTQRPQMAGMIAGGLAAAGMGITLSIIAVFSFLAYSSLSGPLLSQAICSVTANWQSLLVWSVSQGLFYAVNLLYFSLGAPITITNPQNNYCFYVHAPHTTLSLFGTTPQLSPWLHLLLAIPIISLFLGGRVSAAFGRVKGTGAGAVQGALAAIPFTVVCLLLVPLSTVTNTSTITGGSTPSLTTQTAGASAFDLILWALVGGAIVGALGGLYQTSALQIPVSRLLHALALPFSAISAPFFTLLDSISKHPRNAAHSSTRRALYAALLWMILLVIVAVVGGSVLIGLNQTISYAINTRMMNILSTVLVAVPCILLLIVCAVALGRDPTGSSPASVSPNPAIPAQSTPFNSYPQG